MKALDTPLRPIPLLAGCSSDELSQVQALMQSRHFAAGEEVLREGGTDRALWLLLEGRCEVVKDCDTDKNSDADEQQLAIVEAGGVFGEMSFLHPAPHSATVRALSDVHLARLTPESFETLHLECPAAAYSILNNLVGLLADRLRRMDERICQAIEQAPVDRRQEWHDFRARLFAGWDFN